MRGKRVDALVWCLKSRSEALSRVSTTTLSGSEHALKNTLKVGGEADATANAVEEISSNLSMIAAASEEFSVNMQQVQECSRRAEDNIRMVSESTKELSQASDEIAQNTERARAVSSQAVDKVTDTRSQIASLEVVAQEISDVTQVIHDISEQTKVLALNATIEAARDAEAGRGFAVVAREVKDLAAETRQATNFIRTKVDTIGEAISATTGAIEDVARVIATVNEVVNNIAAAAEEQSITTRNIAHHANSANERFSHMAQAIEESGDTIQDVNRRLAQAANKAQSATQLTNSIAAAAEDLRTQSAVNFAHSLEIGDRIQDLNAEFEGLSLRHTPEEQVPSTGLSPFSPGYRAHTGARNADQQKMIEGIDHLHDVISAGNRQSEQTAALEDLVAVTRESFAAEEKTMAQREDPELPAKREAQAMLLSTVAGLVDAIKAGHQIHLTSVLNFLNHRLEQHTQGMYKE